MDFAEALNHISQPTPCKAGKWLASIDPEQAEQINAAIPNNAHNKIYRAIQLMGFDGNGETWRKHAEKTCQCTK